MDDSVTDSEEVQTDLDATERSEDNENEIKNETNHSNELVDVSESKEEMYDYDEEINQIDPEKSSSPEVNTGSEVERNETETASNKITEISATSKNIEDIDEETLESRNDEDNADKTIEERKSENNEDETVEEMESDRKENVDETIEETESERKENVDETIEEMESERKENVDETIEETESDRKENVDETIEETESERKENVDETIEEMESERKENVDETIEEMESERKENVDETIEETESERKENVDETIEETESERKENVDETIEETESERKENVDETIEETESERKENVDETIEETESERKENVDETIEETESTRKENVDETIEETESERKENEDRVVETLEEIKLESRTDMDNIELDTSAIENKGTEGNVNKSSTESIPEIKSTENYLDEEKNNATITGEVTEDNINNDNEDKENVSQIDNEEENKSPENLMEISNESLVKRDQNEETYQQNNDESNELQKEDKTVNNIDDKSTKVLLKSEKHVEKTQNDGKSEQMVLKMADKENFISNFFTVPIQLDDGTIKNQIVTVIKNKNKKPFLGGFRHKVSGVEYHNAAVQTRPRPRPPPTVTLFSRDTQTFQVKHQKINTNNTVSTQMTGPGLYVSNVTDKLIVPGKYETADEYNERILKHIITIQKYYRRWLAKHVVDEKRKQRDDRMEWEQKDKELKTKEKEDRIKKEYERRMHPVTQADFDLLYNGLEKWRLDRLEEINNSDISIAEKKAAKLQLLDEETDLLAAIDRHKIDRKQQNKGEEVHKLLSKAAAPKSWKDGKGRKIQMDTPYTIRSRELLDILNSLNMQYLTQDERLDVLLTLKHTVKEHDCKLTRDIIDLVDREADLIMRNMSDEHLAGLRKRIVTLFLQYCKTPTFNPEISLLLKVPQDPSVLIGDINFCKYCGRYLRSIDFSLSTKSSKLTICKSCARKENQSRKRQDYSHYRRILKDLQMNEQSIDDNSKVAFIFKQNDVKTLMENVWDSKSILSECDDLDELVFVRWDKKDHWSPWNTILITKEEAEAHEKVQNVFEVYSNVMINRIKQKHVIAKNMFESLEKMTDKVNCNVAKWTVKT